MERTSDTEVLARVGAATGRRVFGVGSMLLLGSLLLYVALAQQPDAIWRIFLIMTGATALWAADRLRRATSHGIELTETELRDTSGETLALVEQIAGIDRGLFAFKPSNGFLVKTTVPLGRRWAPGMWWRMGRRIGVGGLVPGHETRLMSDMIQAMIAARTT